MTVIEHTHNTYLYFSEMVIKMFLKKVFTITLCWLRHKWVITTVLHRCDYYLSIANALELLQSCVKPSICELYCIHYCKQNFEWVVICAFGMFESIFSCADIYFCGNLLIYNHSRFTDNNTMGDCATECTLNKPMSSMKINLIYQWHLRVG